MVRLILFLCVYFALLLSAWADPVGSDPLAGFDMDIPELEEKHLTLGGYAEYSGRYAPEKSEFIQSRQKLFAEADYSKDHLKGYFSASASYESAAYQWSGTATDLKLYEAYVGYDGDRFDIFAGNRMVRWGTTDGINPMDLINPTDHIHPVSSARSDSRLPVPLVNSIYTADSFTFEMVIIPEAAVNELSESGSPWESRALKKLRSAFDIADEDEPDGAEAAARIYTTVKGYDFGFIYFNGYADNPKMKIKNGKRVPVYEELEAYGVNFAKGLNKSTVRGELSFKQSDIYEKDYVIGVLGFDRNFDDEEYLNIQLFADNADNDYNGITYELSDKYFRGDLQVGIRGMHYVEDESGTSEIYGKYHYGDAITFSAGVAVIYGEMDSYYGQFGKNDYIYTEVKYSF